MKKIFVPLMVMVISSGNVLANNDTTEVKVKNSAIKVDQTINLQFFLIIRCDSEMDDDFFVTNPPKFSIRYKAITNGTVNLKSIIGKDSITGKYTNIGCKIDQLNTEFVNYLLASGDKSITVSIEKDIIVKLSTGKFGRIKKEEINASINKIKLSDAEREKYLSNPLGYYYSDQKIDFGIQPQNGNNKTGYFFSLKATNSYTGSKYAGNLFWSIDTRLSTNFTDSLNYIKYYPVKLTWRSKNFSTDITIKVGHESNQTFDRKRVAMDMGFSFMPGNMIKLMGPEPRIRPKPIIGFGVKGYYDYSNNISAFASGLAFVNGHYYIPIMDKYALILDGNAFYDFSKTNNPSGTVAGNYAVNFGIDMPKSPFTALFKFANGKTDINYKQGQTIGIGLIMGLIKD